MLEIQLIFYKSWLFKVRAHWQKMCNHVDSVFFLIILSFQYVTYFDCRSVSHHTKKIRFMFIFSNKSILDLNKFSLNLLVRILIHDFSCPSLLMYVAIIVCFHLMSEPYCIKIIYYKNIKVSFYYTNFKGNCNIFCSIKYNETDDKICWLHI